MSGQIPKSETRIRNPKEIRNAKPETLTVGWRLILSLSRTRKLDLVVATGQIRLMHLGREMRFELINEAGKPAVALTENRGIVARDLTELHQSVTRCCPATAQEAHWFGVVAVLFAVLSLLRWGNQLSQASLLKALDEFSFSFPPGELEQAFYRGISEGIESAVVAKLEETNQGVVNRLAEKLEY